MNSILFFLGIVAVAYAQSCGLSDNDQHHIVIEAAYDTPAGIEIWEHATFDITGSEAVEHEDLPYLTGQRFASRYEYLTSDVFGQFIQEQQRAVITRNVTFFCADDSSVDYFFEVKLTEQNNNGPAFEVPDTDVTVNLPWPEISPILTLSVSDASVLSSNADLTFKSSNSLVRVSGNKQWEDGTFPEVHQYTVDLYLTNTTPATGDYEIYITADDGRSSAYSRVLLTIA